ncbi:MAG: efflux RND transporter permease subunit [Candidatus Thermoplasmatota archaeon]
MIILIVTLGFSLTLPSLEFKTSFRDFAPDNNLVKANERVSDYFGTDQSPLFLLVRGENEGNILSVRAIRDIYELEKKLRDIPGVNSTFSITTFINNICLIEYGRPISNCSDREISYAIQDLLDGKKTGWLKIFDNDDPEDFQYVREGVSRYKQRKTYDTRGVDVKQCYTSVSNDTVSFSIEVYDLSALPSEHVKPSLPMVNHLEWYIGFNNLISLSESFNVDYEIAVRIEPERDLWYIGKGIVYNARHIFTIIREHALYNKYKTNVYLYIKPLEQGLMIPYRLDSASVTFDKVNNMVNITIKRDELGRYGIAPSFGSFELPARLSNFTAGVRYNKPSFISDVTSRIMINSDYIERTLSKLSNSYLRSKLMDRILSKYGLTTYELSDYFTMMKKTGMIPGNISMLYIEDSWVHGDVLPEKGSSDLIVSLLPSFYRDMRVNALSFISNDYNGMSASQTLILVLVDKSNDTGELNKVLDKLIEEYDSEYQTLSFDLTGEGIAASEINNAAMEANRIIGPSIFILIIIILFISFRKASYVMLPVLVFACSSIWLFGTMTLLGISFNIIAVALLPINIGLGVEYSVNLLHNYRVEISKGRRPVDAIRRSIKEVGSAIFLAWVTTCVAFLSFLTASLPPVRDFGLFLALGITYTFILDMTLLPSLRYILDKNNSKNNVYKPGVYSIKESMNRLACLLLRHERKILVIIMVLSIIMGFGVLQLKTGFNMNQFIPEDTHSLQVFNNIRDTFPSANQDQEYILIEGDIATTRALKGIMETHNKMLDDRYITRKPDGSLKTESIYTIIKEATSSNNTLYQVFNIDHETLLPSSDNDVKRLYDYLYEHNKYRSMVSSVLYRDHNNQYKATLIRVYIDIRVDAEDMSKEYDLLKKELNNDLSSYGDAEVIVTGQLIITSTIMSSMIDSQIVSTVVCFILAFIMLTLIYRNPLLGLIAMIPVTISIVWVLGTMYLAGYTLNILTITVTSLTIGVGIDYACYITERFRLIADRTGDADIAVIETISRTGNAILIAALSSICGFSILLLAPIPPQQQFGLITATTLVYALITSIIILPLVLARWAKWRKKKKGYIISPGRPDGEYDINDYKGSKCK